MPHVSGKEMCSPSLNGHMEIFTEIHTFSLILKHTLDAPCSKTPYCDQINKSSS